MGHLLYGSTRSNSQQAVATGLRTQTSIQGKARAIGAGQNRLAGNLVDWLGFSAVPQQSQGGKGGGGGGKGQTGTYNYSVTGLVSLGEGPISNVLTIYNGNAIDFLTTPSAQVLADLATLGITPTYGDATYNATFLLGSYSQTAWPLLTTSYGAHALAYRGEALVAFPNLPLGSSPTFPNFNFEVLWSLNSDLPTLGPDANPADWITAYLTNADWGIGFPAVLLGALTHLHSYCRATGMLISPVIVDQGAASSHLGDLMKALGSDFYCSQGQLCVVPYCDQMVFGNGATFIPKALSPVYDLTPDDYLVNQGTLGAGTHSSDSPVLVARKDSAQILNKVQVEFLDRSNLYNPVTIYATNDALIIESKRLRLSDLRAHHFFCLRAAASQSAALQLAREQVVNQYQFTLPPQFILLDPMDVVTLTEPNLGLVRQPVRITEIQENTDRTLTLTAEEVPQTIGAPLYTRQASLGAGRNDNIDPGAINPPIIFEPNDQLGGGLFIWGAVSGANTALWGGCYVWVSYQEGGTYQQIGEIIGPARQGILSAPLATYAQNLNGQTIDNTNVLAIDLGMSDGLLSSGASIDMTSLNTLCYVDGEIMAYQTATLTAAHHYVLSPLVRGAYNSTISAHAAEAPFVRLDASIFKLPYAQSRIGSTLYFKFQSFNIYGGGLQSLAALTAQAYAITGASLASPLPNVANLRTVFDSSFMRLYWDEISDFRSGLQYQISQGPTYATSLPIATVAHPGYIVFGNGTFWITAVCQPSAGLIVKSAAPQSITIAGNVLSSNVVVTSDQVAEGWLGTLVNCSINGAGLLMSAAGVSPAYGTYTIKPADIVNVGYVASCAINVTWTGTGSPSNQNILNVSDFLDAQDILGAASTTFIEVYPQIQIDPGTGTFGPWIKFVPGVYQGQRFNFQLVLVSNNPDTTANALAFNYSVQVPTRLDHYQNQSIAATGTTITFKPDGAATSAPFNGGPNSSAVPYINVSWSQTAGDTYTITALTKSGMTIQFFNGGVGAARSGVNISAEGY